MNQSFSSEPRSSEVASQQTAGALELASTPTSTKAMTRRDLMLSAGQEPGQISELQIRHSWWAVAKIFAQTFCASASSQHHRIKSIHEMAHGCDKYIGEAITDTGLPQDQVTLRIRHGNIVVSMPKERISNPDAPMATCISDLYDLTKSVYSSNEKLVLKGDRYELTFRNKLDTTGKPIVGDDSVFAFQCGEQRWHISVGLAKRLAGTATPSSGHASTSRERKQHRAAERDYYEEQAQRSQEELMSSGDDLDPYSE
jgi:hypothetical protein